MYKLMKDAEILAESPNPIIYDERQRAWRLTDCFLGDTDRELQMVPTPEDLAALEAAKLQAITDGLPSWAAVEAAIDGVTTIAGIKVILKKLARVLYLTVKNKED